MLLPPSANVRRQVGAALGTTRLPLRGTRSLGAAVLRLAPPALYAGALAKSACRSRRPRQQGATGRARIDSSPRRKMNRRRLDLSRRGRGTVSRPRENFVRRTPLAQPFLR